MKIGILGSGNVGKALAKGFVSEGGHEVFLATRDPEGDKAKQLRVDFPDTTVCDFAAAAKEAELVVLCTPWTTAHDALSLADAEHNLAGKVLVDANNPLDRGEDGVRTMAGLEGSAGQMVQSWAPHARVVKCWNSTGADNFYKPQFELTPTMFLCGNDAAAKQQVGELVRSFGWEPFDAGGISAARELEAMAVLWINTAMRGDRHHAFKML